MTKKQQELIAELKVIRDVYMHFVTSSPHERTADILITYAPVGIDKPTATRRANALARLIDRMDKG